MLFNSNQFIFVFLPCCLLTFHVLRLAGWHTASLFALFGFSIYFYSASSPEYTILFLVAICLNYIVGNRLAARPNRLLLTLAIAANLSLIVYFKYLSFGIEQINWISSAQLAVPTMILPVGISFYTFQNITFLVDAHRGKVKERSFIRYGVFVSFFPHLIAGPIVHHADIMPQFDRLEGNSKLDDLAAGLCLFAIGLAKKTMIADPLGMIASPMFDGAAAGVAPNLVSAWIGVLAYTFQIYFDFSAYSDMAYGLALMFGIRLPANFFSPYKSRSIVDFWRRWHMTLSRLLREYVYIPLGGNRRGPLMRYVNLMATMLVGGFWHGAGWTFILWGGLHGCYLVVNHAWSSTLGRRISLGFVAPLLTFLAVLLAWVPFRSVHFDAALSIYQAMFGMGVVALPLEIAQFLRGLGVDPASLGLSIYAENFREDYYYGVITLIVAMLIAFRMPNSIEIMSSERPVLYAEDLLARSRFVGLRRSPKPFLFQFRSHILTGVLTGLVLIIALKIINSAAQSEFLYFQF